MTLHMTIPQLETERLILRVPTNGDTGAMLAFLRSERAEFYGGPMSAYDAWHKFSAYAGQWVLRGYGMYSFVLKDTGQTAGMAGPFHPDHFHEPEMSWLLTSAEFEGRGLAAEACQAVLAHLFGTLGWSSVVSYIDVANTASRKLAERLGASHEADAPEVVPNCQSFRHVPQANTAEAPA